MWEIESIGQIDPLRCLKELLDFLKSSWESLVVAGIQHHQKKLASSALIEDLLVTAAGSHWKNSLCACEQVQVPLAAPVILESQLRSMAACAGTSLWSATHELSARHHYIWCCYQCLRGTKWISLINLFLLFWLVTVDHWPHGLTYHLRFCHNSMKVHGSRCNPSNSNSKWRWTTPRYV